MKANLINIRYNNVDVEVFYQEGHSYKDVFPILEEEIGKLTSLSKIGVKRQFKDWPYQPAPYYKGDTHRICFKGRCLYWNSKGGLSTGPTFGDLRLNG